MTYSISDFFNEGLSAEAGIGPPDVDPFQLGKGIRVEMEHTSDEAVAAKIALDHLAEFPDYYDALERMEKQLARKWGAPRK